MFHKTFTTWIVWDVPGCCDLLQGRLRCANGSDRDDFCVANRLVNIFFISCLRIYHFRVSKYA